MIICVSSLAPFSEKALIKDSAGLVKAGNHSGRMGFAASRACSLLKLNALKVVGAGASWHGFGLGFAYWYGVEWCWVA